jgi:hypothetical protein
VLFPFTGLHKQYHTPDDDWQLIDAPGATQILVMFNQIVRDLASLEAGPTFEKIATPSAGEEEEEPPPAPEHEPEAGAPTQTREHHNASPTGGETSRPARPRVRLGILPDYGATGEPGLVVQSVVDGSAAQAAGMQDNDRIIRIGDKRIRDIYGYMDALRDHQPGDTLEIVVVRKAGDASKEVTLKVTLK